MAATRANTEKSKMCRDCGDRYAQELGLCRQCQRERVAVNTAAAQRCVQCRLTPPHARCVLTQGHGGNHTDGEGVW